MASRLKSDTARTNGAKSHGPITPEGRAKSSTNSIRHGLTAKSVVLPTESTEEFQFLLDSHVDQFHPQTQVEMELVETMTVARWRLRRILTIETNLLHAEMVRHAEVIGRQSNNMDGDDRLARVFQKLANNGQSLALLVRYEGTLNRTYDRALNICTRSSPFAIVHNQTNPSRTQLLPIHLLAVLPRPTRRSARAQIQTHA